MWEQPRNLSTAHWLFRIAQHDLCSAPTDTSPSRCLFTSRQEDQLAKAHPFPICPRGRTYFNGAVTRTSTRLAPPPAPSRRRSNSPNPMPLLPWHVTARLDLNHSPQRSALLIPGTPWCCRTMATQVCCSSLPDPNCPLPAHPGCGRDSGDRSKCLPGLEHGQQRESFRGDSVQEKHKCQPRPPSSRDRRE